MNFFTMPDLNIFSFQNHCCERVLSTQGVLGTQGTAQTARWPYKTLILSNGHFEGPPEVKIKSS